MRDNSGETVYTCDASTPQAYPRRPPPNTPYGNIGKHDYPVGTGYLLERTSAHQISIVPQGGNDGTKPEIGAKVVQIAWNERYVLAKQLGLKRAYPDGPDHSYEIPDETVVRYYILDTIDLALYGGFDLETFERKKAELKIPDELTLQDVEKARSQGNSPLS